MMTAFKTAMYAANPALYARLLAGEVIDTSGVEDEEMRDEISEGGGSIWWCTECERVHSPNRPGCGR